MSRDVVIALFASGLQLMVPILLAALGEILSEQAGVLNVGIEGTMLLGAASFVTVGVYAENLAVALFVATLIGALAGVVLSALYVRRGTDQIVTGLLFTIFAIGLTTSLSEQLIAGKSIDTLTPWQFPLLGRIPGFGEVIKQNQLFWITLLLVVGVHYLMRRTWWGLHVRAVGEQPHAASSAGLNVWRLRYGALILGNALIALGGATLVASSAQTFQTETTGGRGFIALGVVVVARWNPFGALAISLLFGISQALAFAAEQISFLDPVPRDFWYALPYIVTIIAVLLSRGARYPSAVGIPWREPTYGKT